MSRRTSRPALSARPALLAVAAAGAALAAALVVDGALGDGAPGGQRAEVATSERGESTMREDVAEEAEQPAERPAEAPEATMSTDTAIAVFAGGCFWCMEPPYDELEGVLSTTSGYAGGEVENPSYEQVSSGRTGHAEVVRVEYDPHVVGYEKLLDVFWRNVDPTDAGGQFCDRGSQYRSAIFWADEEQRRLAEASKRQLAESGRFEEPIATEIEPLDAFYPAEDYHQDYYREHSLRYKFYRASCGRDRVLRRLWG